MKLKKIYMSEDSVSSAGFFARPCGITPRDQIKEEVFRLFEGYEHGGVLVHAYCASLRQHLNETADEIAFSRIEANLKMIDFLEKNRKALYVRKRRFWYTVIPSGFKKITTKRSAVCCGPFLQPYKRSLSRRTRYWSAFISLQRSRKSC